MAQTAAVWIFATPILAANPNFGQNFDGPDLAWQLADQRTVAKLLAQDHADGGARDRAGCERLLIAAPAGESALLDCATTRIAVLDELVVRMWVNASRPDVQVAARIVMPRSVDSQGAAATALVRGTTYVRPGKWQQLSLTNVTKLLAAEVRVMRAGSNARFDPREAFVQSIVLIVPGEPNGVEVFTDELELDGVVVPNVNLVQLANFDAPPAPGLQSPRPATAAVHATTTTDPPQAVRLQGSLLLIEGKPFLPRIIEWQGESLQFLAEHGFNTIQLPTAPTEDQIAEAGRQSLWFVCAAPKPDEIAQHGLGQPGDRVLAWLLVDDAIEMDPDYGRNWAELVRQHDSVSGRPIAMVPEAEWQNCGKAADILIAHHPRVGCTVDSDFGDWLDSRASLARPGIPLWVCIPTQFGEQVQQQAANLIGDLPSLQEVDADRIEAMVRATCTRGTRGLFFASATPLDEENPQARRRASHLQLLNRYLDIVQPWLAGGKVTNRIESSDAAWSGVVLHVDRVRLLIPIKSQTAVSSNNKEPSAGMPPEEIVFVVPGIPESSQMFLISPVTFRPLPMRRIAGGTQVVVPCVADGMVLITQDPQVIQTFRQRIARDAPNATKLSRMLAEQRASHVTETAKRLAPLGYNAPDVTRTLESVSAALRQCDTLLATGRIEPAYELTEVARHRLSVEAAAQRRLVAVPELIMSHPLALSYDGVAGFAEFWKLFPALREGQNLLYGGDFEDLGQMTEFGWQHVNRPTPGIQAVAKLSTNAPKHGMYCLELFAGAIAPHDEPHALEGPPVWIVSPPVAVEKDQLIEITGWVRVDGAIGESVDGLLIGDTLGGGELALAIRKTTGWQPFHLIRFVPESTELRLTFVLTGAGTTHIDGVMVRTLTQPIARRLPFIPPGNESPTDNTARNAGPLFVAPETR